MTNRELKKLSRADLVELLLELTRENDQLRGELNQVKQKLESREISLEQAGSLADAALQLNGVFASAQAACEQYSENIRLRSESQEEICRKMERQTREKCEAMVSRAKQEADEYWAYVRSQVRQLYLTQDQEDSAP